MGKQGGKPTHAGEQAGSRAEHGWTILTYLPSRQVPIAPAWLGVTGEGGRCPGVASEGVGLLQGQPHLVPNEPC